MVACHFLDQNSPLAFFFGQASYFLIYYCPSMWKIGKKFLDSISVKFKVYSFTIKTENWELCMSYVAIACIVIFTFITTVPKESVDIIIILHFKSIITWTLSSKLSWAASNYVEFTMLLSSESLTLLLSSESLSFNAISKASAIYITM